MEKVSCRDGEIIKSETIVLTEHQARLDGRFW